MIRRFIGRCHEIPKRLGMGLKLFNRFEIWPAAPQHLPTKFQRFAILSTHLPLVPHMCVIERASIGSDNGLSPFRRQTIILTNAGILSIGPLWTNFSEILIKIQNFSFTKMHLEISSILSRGRWVNTHPGSWHGDFAKSGGKTSYYITNRCACVCLDKTIDGNLQLYWLQ